ncbi:hypothetical protein [Luteolibacter pohnpeiensis]|nr:hypothetical protein [Luteolibacter pohnpeiensis]
MDFQAWPENEDEWRGYFDLRALDHFWWPTASELEDWKRLYFAAPVDKRQTPPRLQHPWDFMSMPDAFKNGDDVLVNFEENGERGGRSTFDPHGDPYSDWVHACDHRSL